MGDLLFLCPQPGEMELYGACRCGSLKWFYDRYENYCPSCGARERRAL